MNFIELEGMLHELEQTTATLGLIQTAFAEGSAAVNNDEATEALMFLYMKQRDTIKIMKQLLKEREHEPSKQKERDAIMDMLREIDDEKYLRRIRFYVSGFVGQDGQ